MEKRFRFYKNSNQIVLFPAIGFAWGYNSKWKVSLGFLWLNFSVSIGIIKKKNVRY